MTTALVSFGANLAGRNPDLTSVLENVRLLLSKFKHIGRVTVSRGYRTPAFPPGSGPDFLNAALRFPTNLRPDEVLSLLHDIEAQMGRTRTRRWEPRVCDLDLLGLGDTILPDPATVMEWMDLSDDQAIERFPDKLLLPHPRLHRRNFVLIPLADIAPDWRHPILGTTVADLANRLPPEERAQIRPC